MLIEFINKNSVSGDNVSFSNEFSKSGSTTLNWKFKYGDSIVISRQGLYSEGKSELDSQEKFAFACFVGAKTNFSGHINVSFCENEQKHCEFDFITNFVGWRYIRILFSQMKGIPSDKINNIKLTAFGDGELWFDEVVTNFIDERFVSPSHQLPFLKETSYIDGRYNAMGFQSADIADGGLIDSPKLKEKYKPIKFENTSIIMRLCNYILDEFSNLDCEQVRSDYYSLNITEDESGFLKGVRIENEIQRRMMKGTPEEHKKYVSVTKCSVIGRNLAACFKETNDKWFRDAYITLVRYMMQCGVCEGSILSSRHLIDYALRPLYMSFILMKNELDAEGLSDDASKLCIWYCNMERQCVYQGIEHRYSTADDFMNVAIGFVTAALLMNNESESSKWLFALKDWLERNMSYSPGLLGLYKEDGSIFHHCGLYPAYGLRALAGVIPIVYALSDTPYAISEEAWKNTKNILETSNFYCTNGFDGKDKNVPNSFSGRMPFTELKLDKSSLKYFALAAPSYNDTPISDEMSGNKMLSMACAMLHRYDNQLVIMKGFSKYIWGNESYPMSNLYGRYSSYGAVEILGNTLHDSGFEHNGYDFRHIGGITAIIPPWDEFKQKVNHLDEYSGVEEMLISDRSFAGGVSDGNSGMFSMILAEHPKYDGTHFAIKSGFFVDGFLLFLGSNIKNNSIYPTETTLFQNYVGENCADSSLTDVLGNKYYVPKWQKTEVRVQKQCCPLSTGNGMGEGVFKTAVIRHGISPVDDKYEYAIGINGADCKPYKIIQSNEIAHIVNIDGILFMAIYKPSEFEGFGEVVSVDLPVLIMVNRMGEMFICNPDLGLYDYDKTQYNEKGERIEVSIYSREWLGNDVSSKECTLITKSKIFNLILKGGKTYKIENE